MRNFLSCGGSGTACCEGSLSWFLGALRICFPVRIFAEILPCGGGRCQPRFLAGHPDSAPRARRAERRQPIFPRREGGCLRHLTCRAEGRSATSESSRMLQPRLVVFKRRAFLIPAYAGPGPSYRMGTAVQTHAHNKLSLQHSLFVSLCVRPIQIRSGKRSSRRSPTVSFFGSAGSATRYAILMTNRTERKARSPRQDYIFQSWTASFG